MGEKKGNLKTGRKTEKKKYVFGFHSDCDERKKRKDGSFIIIPGFSSSPTTVKCPPRVISRGSLDGSCCSTPTSTRPCSFPPRKLCVQPPAALWPLLLPPSLLDSGGGALDHKALTMTLSDAASYVTSILSASAAATDRKPRQESWSGEGHILC